MLKPYRPPHRRLAEGSEPHCERQLLQTFAIPCGIPWNPHKRRKPIQTIKAPIPKASRMKEPHKEYILIIQA